jgi:hypothetical protein
MPKQQFQEREDNLFRKEEQRLDSLLGQLENPSTKSIRMPT